METIPTTEDDNKFSYLVDVDLEYTYSIKHEPR